MIKCDKCNNGFSAAITRADGNPSGLTFEMQSGKKVNLCADCIMELGRRDEAGKAEFFKDLGIETE